MGGEEAADRESFRERVSGSRVKLWVLLGADRNALAGLLLLGLLCWFVALGAMASPPLPALMRSGDPVGTLFQALVTAIITGVTLVVTIAQLVLSQELGPVSDKHEHMQGAMSFREDVEAVIEPAVAPADPGSFLAAILDGVRTRADALGAVADGVSDPARKRRLRAYADSVATDAERGADRLDGATFGTFEVVDAALQFNYSDKINRGRLLRQDVEDDTADRLGTLVEALTFYGTAREHVKTLYFEWELVDLSRAIVAVAVPALAVAAAMVLYGTDPGAVPGATLGVANVTLLVAAAATVALAPFAVLLSYVLRIVTVAKRTVAIGPFVLREREGDGEE